MVRRFKRKKVAKLRLQTGNWSLSEYAGDEIDEVDDDTDLEDMEDIDVKQRGTEDDAMHESISIYVYY